MLMGTAADFARSDRTESVPAVHPCVTAEEFLNPLTKTFFQQIEEGKQIFGHSERICRLP